MIVQCYVKSFCVFKCVAAGAFLKIIACFEPSFHQCVFYHFKSGEADKLQSGIDENKSSLCTSYSCTCLVFSL